MTEITEPSSARAATGRGRLRILLLCSAFNGLSQRAWAELREAGHHVQVQLARDPGEIPAAATAMDPDLVICPFLKERVPSEVWSRWPTIVLHPGPRGDRGPSSLDWALMAAEPVWGVTAVQAADEMDAGPIWGSREFLVEGPVRKSDLYNGAVSDAALELIHESVIKVADRSFVPEPLDYQRGDVWGRLRPAARQIDRSFCWSDPSERILRRIRAADGAPGVHTRLCGLPVAVFDAHPAAGTAGAASPGTVMRRRHGAVQVSTGDGAIWVGHLRSLAEPVAANLKLPAACVLRERIDAVPEAPDDGGYREITYQRDDAVGVLSFDFYNGAMSTEQCRRLEAALVHATSQDTRVLVLRGGSVFSSGIHLGVIEACADPVAEAWANIVAIDDVCRQIITCTSQLVVSAVAGNAGAGGVMLACGAGRVLLRHGVVLNPHYQTMGLYGSEYWTYVLPRRVGPQAATALTTGCAPMGSAEALRTGLADQVIRAAPAEFGRAVARYAAELACAPGYCSVLARQREAREADEQRRPLSDYRRAELGRMWSDIVGDEHGFAQARRAFLFRSRGRSRSSVSV